MRFGVLIAVTHLLGIGHYARAAAIARALAAAGHDVTLVSGGRSAPLVPTGGVRLVQLPPLHVTGADFSALRDDAGALASADLLAARRDRLLAALADATPTVVITELFPFGRRRLAGEFLALVEAARRLERRPTVMASIRDILVAPSKPDRLAEAHERLRHFYDAILVHADPAIVRLDASWPLDPSLQPLVHYTGYVHDRTVSAPAPTEDGIGEVLVSGGGSAAALPLHRAAVAAAALVPERRWRILVGGLSERACEDLSAGAPQNVVVEPARSDFATLLSRCAVSVSQAGYNTVLEVLSAQARAIVVPFEDAGETEQRARAERFAAPGLLSLLPAADLTPETLARTVRERLAAKRPEPPVVDMNGLAETIRLVEAFAGRRHTRVGPRRPILSAASTARITRALDQAAGEGRSIELWWRDDDAVAPSGALDRLLALARRTACPVAIAAIPAEALPALAERLREEPLASILVHGLTHANHAPAGDRKAEFGRHRPYAALRRDADEGLQLARERFGRLAIPVFVPPWNRLAPDLVGALPGVGYRGLSTAGPRLGQEAAPGLVQANVHIDPIEWRGRRGLASRDKIVATLVGAMDGRPPGGRHDEPVGLLTHHLIHDEPVWAFCEALIELLASHPAVQMTHARDLFACNDDRSIRETGVAAG